MVIDLETEIDSVAFDFCNRQGYASFLSKVCQHASLNRTHGCFKRPVTHQRVHSIVSHFLDALLSDSLGLFFRNLSHSWCRWRFSRYWSGVPC